MTRRRRECPLAAGEGLIRSRPELPMGCTTERIVKERLHRLAMKVERSLVGVVHRNIRKPEVHSVTLRVRSHKGQGHAGGMPKFGSETSSQDRNGFLRRSLWQRTELTIDD